MNTVTIRISRFIATSRVLLFVISALVPVPHSIRWPKGQDGDDQSNAFRYLSMIDACVANCNAWNQFDVLIRQEYGRDLSSISAEKLPTGSLAKTVRFTRIIADRNSGNFATFFLETVTEIDFGTPDQINDSTAERAALRSEAWIVNAMEGRVLKLDSQRNLTGWHRDQFTNDVEMLRTIRFPDVRTLWIFGELKPADKEPKEILSVLKSGRNFDSVSIKGQKVRLKFRVDDGIELPETVTSFYRILDFDIESYALKRQGFVAERIDGPPIQYMPCDLEWREIDGLQVPVDIHSSRDLPAGSEFRDIRIKWGSLNTPLDEKLFSLKQFDNKDKAITSMTDWDSYVEIGLEKE